MNNQIKKLNSLRYQFTYSSKTRYRFTRLLIQEAGSDRLY